MVAVDLYGHGHTGFVDGRGLSYEEMADDIGALIAHLGLAQADVMGYSLGGGQRDPGWDGSAGRSASQLAILPGVNHYVMAEHPLLAAAVERFLAGK